jgi:predicted house-cleaning noncanonical NTP pyrophosphatase (MazG superfamily)
MLNQDSVVRLKHISSQSELLRYYRNKIVEEAAEVSSAESTEDLIEKLADLVEIVHGLAYILKTDFEAIEEARLSKRQLNGGFAQGLIVDTVQIEEDNALADYYAANYEHVSSEP